MIQKFEAGGSQRDVEAALQRQGSGIRGFVGLLCGERGVRQRRRTLIKCTSKKKCKSEMACI